MRELVYYVAVSLDGYIAAPDHTFDAFPVTGDHMDTILRDYADALPAPALAALGLTPSLARFDTVLMGWNTYAVGLAQGLDNPYPHLRQHVFTRTRTAAPGSPAARRSRPPSSGHSRPSRTARTSGCAAGDNWPRPWPGRSTGWS